MLLRETTVKELIVMLMLLPAQQVLFVDVLDVVLDVDIDDVVVGVVIDGDILIDGEGSEEGLNFGVDNDVDFDLIDVVDFGDVIVVVDFVDSVDIIVYVVVDFVIVDAIGCRSGPLCVGEIMKLILIWLMLFIYFDDVIVCVVVDIDDVAGATRCQSRPLCRGCLQTPPTPRVRCPSTQDSGI